jgi:DNA-binding NarL/FixJ family response regulator
MRAQSLRVPMAERQAHVLRTVAAGGSYAQVAAAWGTTVQVVKNYVHLELLPELCARTITHAVAIALREGLIK